jgi:hypothetical protein
VIGRGRCESTIMISTTELSCEVGRWMKVDRIVSSGELWCRRCWILWYCYTRVH